jgi:hypothetical protein
MNKRAYAIAFVGACAVGAAFGTSPLAGEAVKGGLTFMDGCAETKCSASKHVVGSANGHPEMKQYEKGDHPFHIHVNPFSRAAGHHPAKAEPADNAINTKGTGTTRVKQSAPKQN